MIARARLPCGLGLMLCLACTSSSDKDIRWLVLQEGNLLRIDPGARIPPASRIQIWDEARPKAPEGLVPRELFASGAPSFSWDRKRLVFVGREDPKQPLGLYVTELDALETRRLPLGDQECGSADFLPDWRVVYSARIDEPAPIPELESSWALFVYDPESDEKQRITYGLSEIDPTVLADGRILYSQWQPGGDGRASNGAFGIFAVHPDGTGVTAVHGFHDGPRWKLQPRQIADGNILFLGGDQVDALHLRRIDAHSPGSPSEVVATGAEASEVASVSTRSRPQGHLSMVKAELNRGQVFGIGTLGPGLENAKRLRFLLPSSQSDRAIGEVELAEDGSYFVELPANRPILFELLDGEDHILAASTTPIWIRPGEKRGCVGCHEDPQTAPPNRRPLAVLDEPIDLVGGRS